MGRSVRRAVVVGVLVLGGAVGCGGEAAEVEPADAVAEAAARAEGVESVRYRVAGELPETGRVEADAVMRSEPAAVSMKVSTGGKGAVPVRFVDDVMYVGKAADGKKWLRADAGVWGGLTVDNNSYGALPRQLESSPLVQSTLLTGAKDVREVGSETVDGTRTTHYRGTVTFDGLRAAGKAAQGEAARERLTASLDQFMGLRVSDTLTMDLWIDGDDHAKRFRWQAQSDGGPLDLTITFLDIDRPVTIEAPPADAQEELGS